MREHLQDAAVIYCRVSTVEQTENFSLSTQEKACRGYCQKNGILTDKIFIEQGESAKTINRTAFKEMLEYCFKYHKRIRYVIVHNVSRFARSTHDHLKVRNQLREHGIVLRSVTEPFDDSAWGKYAETTLSAAAELDNNIRAERTVVGMKAAIEARKWPFRAPIGYLRGVPRIGPSIVPDPTKAHFVRKAFEMFAEGVSTKREVLDHMTKLGLTNSAGKPLNAQSFELILGNPLYAGLMRVKKWRDVKPFQGDFEPLISREIFDQVQYILSGRKAPFTTHSRDNPDFPLRHFVRCGHCGKPLTASRNRGRNGTLYPNYRCPSATCTRGKKSVSRQKMEGLFLSYLESVAPSAQFLNLFEKIFLDVWETTRVEVLTLVKSLEQQLESLLEGREKIESARFVEESMPPDVYERHHAKFDAEIAAKEIELSEAKIEELDVEGILVFARNMLENAANLWRELPPNQKRRFQEVIFPQGLTFTDGEFGTTALSPVFNHLRDFPSDKKEMATRHGFEP